jgi:hypothetical protein
MRSASFPLLPLLALGLACAFAAPARAQDHTYLKTGATSTSLQVNFGITPHWTAVAGTQVEELPANERQDYDLFRFGGTYYAYNNSRWYMSPRASGEFTVIDERSVPSEFSGVPRDHWRNYPQGWEGRNDQGAPGVQASLHVNLGNTPHWTGIQGTRVEELPAGERPNYDMFRYGGTYYAYNNDRWFMSSQASGEFTPMDDRSVPSEFSGVPREHWRNYPTGWRDRQGQGSDVRSAPLQVNLDASVHWSGVRGTRVRELRGNDRPDYDVFRYGGAYYAYSNQRWYMSRRGNGSFAVIEEGRVPAELARVPRERWRNYPARWMDESGTQRPGRRDRR